MKTNAYTVAAENHRNVEEKLNKSLFTILATKGGISEEGGELIRMVKQLKTREPDLSENIAEEQSVEGTVEASEISLLRREVEWLRERVEKLERGS